MNFDVVIATRNRVPALELTLPLLLSQSRLPGQIIIVDSSSDPAPVQALVARLQDGTRVPFRFIHVEKASSSGQRNLGLTHVTADVTFFPDDDSLCFPGATEALMRAYERDTERRIAGVCARPMSGPPPGVQVEGAYAMLEEHKRIAQRVKLFRRIEEVIGNTNPLIYLSSIIRKGWPEIPWLEAEDCVTVPWMTGFRMSFRTECIRDPGFETTFSGYAMFEDFDASFSAGRKGALVAAHGAGIYHHRFPSGRLERYPFGAFSVLNRAFVLAKQREMHGLPLTEKRRLESKLRQFIRLRSAPLMLRARRDPGAGEELRGTRDALRHMPRLFAAGPDIRPAVYAEICAELALKA